MKRLVIDDYFGRHKQDYAAMLTTRMELDAKDLIEKVNRFCDLVGIRDAVITSGWRPAPYNAKIGGAKNSAHVSCQAVDLWDFDRTIARKIMSCAEGREPVYLNNARLAECGLWVEDVRHTVDWVHFQTRPVMSGMRVFNPYSDPNKKPTDPLLTGKIKRS